MEVLAPRSCRAGERRGPDVRKVSFSGSADAGGTRPQTRAAGRTHQQLRLKTLSRRVKQFTARTLGGGRFGLQGDGRGGDMAGRSPIGALRTGGRPAPALPRKAAAPKCTRLKTATSNRPAGPQSAARQPERRFSGRSGADRGNGRASGTVGGARGSQRRAGGAPDEVQAAN